MIGAGFGGLSAALALAERGARVLLCESLRYPGGCASTFERGGMRFEAGATLFSGFDPGQPFRRWIDRHAMDVRVDPIDPLVELRTGALSLAVARDRARLVEAFCAMEGAPADRLRAFFAEQRAVADALWGLLDAPELLPPLSVRSILAHAARLPRYAPVLRAMGRPLKSVLARHRLEGFEPLRQYLDATLQITVQTSSARAEAPFALSALDYYFRGTGHVHGGIGALANAMVRAIERCGGAVRMSDRVQRVERLANGWRVHARRGTIDAERVVANVLPSALERLLGRPNPTLTDLSRKVSAGWGAAMLYLAVEDHPGLAESAKHLELVDDPSAPFTEGNHVFVSLSARDERERAPAGLRTATCSTHLPVSALRGLDPSAQGDFVRGIQDRMRSTLARRAPEVAGRIARELPASPRTFERFTGRPEGLVGGIPRATGLAQYRRLWPSEVERGLWLVGDSVGLGQSTLATAVTAMRTVDAMLGPRGIPEAPRALDAGTSLTEQGAA